MKLFWGNLGLSWAIWVYLDYLGLPDPYRLLRLLLLLLLLLLLAVAGCWLLAAGC